MSMLQSITDYVYKFDVFISYCWDDFLAPDAATDELLAFPAALARRLRSPPHKYRVFLDHEQFVAGTELKAATKRRVKMSQVLVLLLRPGAMTSDYVYDEVKTCIDAGRTPIIVDFAGTLEASSRDNRLRRLISSDERDFLRIELPDDAEGDTKTSGDQTPNEASVATLVPRLVEHFKFTRQETRLFRTVSVALFLAVVALVAIGGLWDRAVEQRKEAERFARRTRSGRCAMLSTIELGPERAVLLAAEGVATTQRFDEPTPPETLLAFQRATAAYGGHSWRAHDRPIPLEDGYEFSRPSGARFIPDTSLLLTTGSGGRVQQWDTSQYAYSMPPKTLHTESSWIRVELVTARWAVVRSDERMVLVAANGNPGESRAIEVFRAGLRHWAYRTAVSPSERWLFVSQDPKIPARVVDLESTAEEPRWFDLPVGERLLGFTGDNRWLLTRKEGNPNIRLHELGDDGVRLDAGQLEGPYRAVALAGTTLATRDDEGTLQRWQFEEPGTLQPREHPLPTEVSQHQSLNLANDGDIAAIAGEEIQLVTWQDGIASLRTLSDSGTGEAAFSPDGNWYIFGPARSFDLYAVHLPSIRSTDNLEPLRLRGGQSGSRRDLTFSHDGHWLAADDRDGVRLCDLTRPDPFGYSFVLGGASPDGITFSSDGRWVVALSSGARLHLFPLKPDDLMGFAKNIIGRNLTVEEWAEFFPNESYRKTFPYLAD